MEAKTAEPKRILQRAEEAKSPQRILVRLLLKSRNMLRAKYRTLRVECKRSRSTWRERARASEASAQEERAARAAVAAQLQLLQEQVERRDAELAQVRARLTAGEGAVKKGR